jgi:hypothetical protein
MILLLLLSASAVIFLLIDYYSNIEVELFYGVLISSQIILGMVEAVDLVSTYPTYYDYYLYLSLMDISLNIGLLVTRPACTGIGGGLFY